MAKNLWNKIGEGIKTGIVDAVKIVQGKYYSRLQNLQEKIDTLRGVEKTYAKTQRIKTYTNVPATNHGCSYTKLNTQQ